MTHVEMEMERWRNFFGKSGADIWTVIHEAITVGAMDYPKDFRERRDQIAETLFDRSLLQRQVKDDPVLLMLKAPINGSNVRELHDDVEALSDELEEEALILRDLNCIKATLADAKQPESVILEALQGLQYMQITVDNLKVTEIGKHVRSLKKHPCKRVQAAAKELMRQWKILIDEWVDTAKDVTAVATTAATGTDCGDCLEDGKQGAGLLSPPLDEGALLEASTPNVDLSQLFSFMEGEDLCTGMKDSQIHSNSIEPSVRDNSSYLCRSQSGSMLTDFSEFDTKASSNYPWGLTTAEERGSATRDMYLPSSKLEREKSALKGQASHHSKDAGLQVSKNGSGPGRPYNEISKAKPVLGVARVKPVIDDNNMGGSDVLHSIVSTHASNVDKSCGRSKPTSDYSSFKRSNVSNADKSCVMKSGKNQLDQKLEIAKRKLHQGYQQAENVKRQRTVQVLNSSDLQDATKMGKAKMNTRVNSKELPNFGHAGKAKMSAPVHNKEHTNLVQVGKAKMNAPVHIKTGVHSGQWSQNKKSA